MMVLVHKGTSVPVAIGEEVTDFRGDKAVVTGWQQPQHAGSTGRIYTHPVGEPVDYAQGYYPSVFNCEWKEQ